jgi:uncharacterized protein (DUF433 family)
MVADGMTDAEILVAYPDLEPADIRVSLPRPFKNENSRFSEHSLSDPDP